MISLDKFKILRDISEYCDAYCYDSYEFLYILEFSKGTKIGRSSKPRERINSYLSPWCLPLTSFKLTHCPESKLIEKEWVHNLQKDFLPIGEEFFPNIGSCVAEEYVLQINPSLNFKELYNGNY